MVDVGDAVDQSHDPALERGGQVRPGVAQDAVAYLLGEVEPAAVALEHVDHPQRVLVVAKAAPEALLQARVERLLADVAEGGWPRSCPRPIASVRSSFSRSARATVREIPHASSVCVSRVR